MSANPYQAPGLSKLQTEKHKHAKAGSSGKGAFFHIELTHKHFEEYRSEEVGEYPGIERVSGKDNQGHWHTVKWLLSKERAHLEGQHLIADDPEAQDLLDDLRPSLHHLKADRFKAAYQQARQTLHHQTIEADGTSLLPP